MEVDIEEDENEPELTYPYEEVDPLNPPSPASESEPENAIEVENPTEHKDKTVPASVMEGKNYHTIANRQGNINSLFGRMASLSRRLCGRETAHALVEKKGKAKDEYYAKLILDLGNEVRSSVEQGTAAMEKLVEKLGNAEDKVGCKRLKKELKDATFSNTFLRDLDQLRGQDAAPAARKCTFAGFMKCNPTAFHGTEGAVELLRWFEKTESVFGISDCAEGIEEIQRMEHELWNLKVKEYNIMAYTQRFNELAMMCPQMVEPERVKVDAYIRGLIDNIKDEVTSSKPANLNEAMRMAHKLMDQKSQARDERILEAKKRKWESFQSGNSSGKGNQRDNSRQTLQNNQRQGNARARLTLL
ncbi:hypothetical protein Tco_0730914 [Tanacetum coccineum]